MALMATFISRIEEARIEDQTQRRAEKLGLPYLDMRTVELDLEALRVIPENKARQLKATVFRKKMRDFSLATINPETEELKQLIKEIKKFGSLTVFVVSQITNLSRKPGRQFPAA